MAISRKDESRLLTQEERALVGETRNPKLGAHSDTELTRLVGLVRERRKRARDIANRQGREMRGKAAPSGAAAATRSDGTQQKAQVLAAALKRLNNERIRRAKASAKPSQVAVARRALRLKKAAGSTRITPPHRTPAEGMHPIESERREDLTRRDEVGRVTAFVAAAQAKKDARD